MLNKKSLRISLFLILFHFFYMVSFVFSQSQSDEGMKTDRLKRFGLPSVYDRTKNVQKLDFLIGNKIKGDFIFSDITLSSYLKLFSTQYPVNIVNMTAKKTKKISVSFKDYHPAIVFELLMNTWGCDWYFRGGVITIVDDIPVKAFQLEYIKVRDISEQFKEVLDLYSVTYHEGTNMIIAKGNMESLDKLQYLINKFDIAPKQVLIDVKIVELTTTSQDSLGFDFNFDLDKLANGSKIQTSGFSTSSDSSGAAGLFVKSLQNELLLNFNAYLANAKSEVLARPKVLVTNHQTAKIITGQRLGYSTVTSTGATSIQTIKFLESGIKLEFTPHIADGNKILMEIIPEISEGRIEQNIPRESTIRTETQVLVKDGQTIVIGGLIQNKTTDSVSGVPILSDIPILNLIFQKTTVLGEKREVVVLITPKIVDIDKEEDVLIPISVQKMLEEN